ncbi:hypothetical protein NDN08_007760 [Rhodosorus marinus]|uniref:HEAT repeat domain-containing protein n=1 Tax=Rhodosorus marinus TaxID=101924 RepID=A0AAV8V1A3_9RHOD|nr:hypothetical protein NDN08_007760 [Rhodosorus marinus]
MTLSEEELIDLRSSLRGCRQELDEQSASGLLPALGHHDFRVRVQAVRALSEGQGTVKELEHVFLTISKEDWNTEVRIHALDALVTILQTKAHPVVPDGLVEMLETETGPDEALIKRAIIRAIAASRCSGTAGVRLLLVLCDQLMRTDDPDLQADIFHASTCLNIEELSWPSMYECLSKRIRAPIRSGPKKKKLIRSACAKALGEIYSGYLRTRKDNLDTLEWRKVCDREVSVILSDLSQDDEPEVVSACLIATNELVKFWQGSPLSLTRVELHTVIRHIRAFGGDLPDLSHLIARCVDAVGAPELLSEDEPEETRTQKPARTGQSLPSLRLRSKEGGALVTGFFHTIQVQDLQWLGIEIAEASMFEVGPLDRIAGKDLNSLRVEKTILDPRISSRSKARVVILPTTPLTQWLPED